MPSSIRHFLWEEGKIGKIKLHVLLFTVVPGCITKNFKVLAFFVVLFVVFVCFLTQNWVQERKPRKERKEKITLINARSGASRRPHLKGF